MKESYSQLETSTIELTKIRSNTSEGSSLSINEELQVDTFFTQGNLEINVNNTYTKDKGKQLQKQLCQQEKCKEHNTKPTIDREKLEFCLVRDEPDALLETITAQSSQSITQYFNKISTTRERKNVQITDDKKNKKNIAI